MGTKAARDRSLDLDLAQTRFEESIDFTMAVEEEFSLLDPATLELSHGFEAIQAEAQDDPVLADSVRGELIDTEVEIRSGRAESFTEMCELQRESRRRLFALAERQGLALGAMGTHPWAGYLDQQIIDTPHYLRLRDELGYVAQRNNTWSLHVHVGVNGPDRAIGVCDRLREELPLMLAISANSPFLDRHDTRLHSVRTQIFTRSFPRCGIHDPFGDWRGYSDFIDALVRTNSVVESTQLWWSVRPHHNFGTVEVRICDAQSDGEASLGLAGLLISCVAQAALDHDAGRPPTPQRPREVEENLWRAIRYGLDGRMIDWKAGTEITTREAAERLLAWTEPARMHLGIPEFDVLAPNGAQRARAELDAGSSVEEVYAENVELTKRSYVTPGSLGSTYE